MDLPLLGVLQKVTISLSLPELDAWHCKCSLAQNEAAATPLRAGYQVTKQLVPQHSGLCGYDSALTALEAFPALWLPRALRMPRQEVQHSQAPGTSWNRRTDSTKQCCYSHTGPAFPAGWALLHHVATCTTEYHRQWNTYHGTLGCPWENIISLNIII